MDPTQGAPEPTSRLTLLAGIALLVGLVVFGWAAPATFYVYMMIHVVAAVIWVGGGVTLVVLVLLTEREGDPRALVSLAHKIEFIATRIFIPSSFLSPLRVRRSRRRRRAGVGAPNLRDRVDHSLFLPDSPSEC